MVFMIGVSRQAFIKFTLHEKLEAIRHNEPKTHFLTNTG